MTASVAIPDRCAVMAEYAHRRRWANMRRIIWMYGSSISFGIKSLLYQVSISFSSLSMKLNSTCARMRFLSSECWKLKSKPSRALMCVSRAGKRHDLMRRVSCVTRTSSSRSLTTLVPRVARPIPVARGHRASQPTGLSLSPSSVRGRTQAGCYQRPHDRSPLARTWPMCS